MTQKPTIETNVVKPRMFFSENQVEYRIISEIDEKNLDTIISSIQIYMSDNDGRFQSEEQKDLLYANSKKMWEDYALILRNVKLSLFFNKKQFEFLTNILLEDLEYDVNTVFFAIELTNMLKEWNKADDFENDTDLKCLTADATEVTYIYHLIAKHKIKGLTDEAYRFAQVLRRIGEVSKVINYYDTTAKNLAKEIQEWVASFDTNPVTSKTLQPK